MVEEPKNELDLSDEDLANMKTIMNELIEAVVVFNGLEEITEASYAALKEALDFATFVVNGVIYANGMDLCAHHDHDDDE